MSNQLPLDFRSAEERRAAVINSLINNLPRKPFMTKREVMAATGLKRDQVAAFGQQGIFLTKPISASDTQQRIHVHYATESVRLWMINRENELS